MLSTSSPWSGPTSRMARRTNRSVSESPAFESQDTGLASKRLALRFFGDTYRLDDGPSLPFHPSDPHIVHPTNPQRHAWIRLWQVFSGVSHRGMFAVGKDRAHIPAPRASHLTAGLRL